MSWAAITRSMTSWGMRAMDSGSARSGVPSPSAGRPTGRRRESVTHVGDTIDGRMDVRPRRLPRARGRRGGRPGDAIAGLVHRPASFAAGLDAAPGLRPPPGTFGARNERRAPARNFRDAAPARGTPPGSEDGYPFRTPRVAQEEGAQRLGGRVLGPLSGVEPRHRERLAGGRRAELRHGGLQRRREHLATSGEERDQEGGEGTSEGRVQGRRAAGGRAGAPPTAPSARARRPGAGAFG